MGARRQPGEGSIYQRESDGRWVGVVDLGWIGGRRVRKTVTAKTLKELRPKYRALKEQIDSGIVPDDATVEQWLKHWMDEVAGKKLRPSTLTTYQGYIDNWVVPNLGRRRLADLRPDHIRALYSKMEAEGRSDATRRQVHAILRRALVVAERDGRIGSNPAAKVDAPSVGQGTHGKFTLAEARRLLQAVAEYPPQERARWVSALLAGVRQGEALGLSWELDDGDIDFAAGTMRIARASQRIKGQGIQIVPLKSKASYRMIPIQPIEPVRLALESIPTRTGFVFGTHVPMDPRRDYQQWRDLLEEADVPRRPLHAARATTASLLSEAGVPDKVIAEILGHSQVIITQRHYISGDESVHRNAFGKLNTLLGLE